MGSMASVNQVLTQVDSMREETLLLLKSLQ